MVDNRSEGAEWDEKSPQQEIKRGRRIEELPSYRTLQIRSGEGGRRRSRRRSRSSDFFSISRGGTSSPTSCANSGVLSSDVVRSITFETGFDFPLSTVSPPQLQAPQQRSKAADLTVGLPVCTVLPNSMAEPDHVTTLFATVQP